MGQLEAEFRNVIRDEIAPLCEQVSALITELRARTGRKAPQSIGPSPPQMGDYLTFKEAASVIRRSARTIRRMVADGKLRTCGPRGEHIARFEIARFMEAAPPKDPGHDDLVAEADRLLDDHK